MFWKPMTEMTDEIRRLSSKWEIYVIFKDKRGCISGLWNYACIWGGEHHWELSNNDDRRDAESFYTHFAIITEE